MLKAIPSAPLAKIWLLRIVFRLLERINATPAAFPKTSGVVNAIRFPASGLSPPTIAAVVKSSTPAERFPSPEVPSSAVPI